MTVQGKQGMGRGTFLLASIACLVLLQLCFVASNVGANMLPKTVLQERAEASWASPMLTNIYRYDTSIATIPVCYDNNRFIIEVAQQRSWDDPLTTSVRASIADRSPEGVDVPFDYFRYWHGWQMLCGLGLLGGGAVYCFLDFLTIPAAVLAMVVFCGTIACRRQDSTIRWHLSTIACITIAFGTGFLATWMFKWVLAAIVIGPEYVVGNVIGEMNIWTSEHGELPQPDWASWLKSLYSLSPQLFALLAPLGYMTLSSPLLAAAILAAVALCLLVWRLAPSSCGRAAAVSSICRDTVGQS